MAKKTVRQRSRDAFAEMDREIEKINKSGELNYIKKAKSKAPAKAKAKDAPPKAAPPKQQKAAPPKQQKAAPPKQQPERRGARDRAAATDAFAEMEGTIKAGREKYGPGYRGETQTMQTGPDGKKRVSHTVRTAPDKKKKRK